MNERLIRATKKTPCPICGRPSWCGFTRDGLTAFCMQISDGSEATAKNGANVHRLGPQPAPVRKPSATAQPASQQATLAPIDHRHKVLTALLDEMKLSGGHASALVGRGLSDTEIVRQRYSTAPDERAAQVLTDLLASRFGSLAGIPGFYRKDGRWRLVRVDPGLLIPVRDERGRIQALRLRRDTASKDHRYVWISSRDYLAGTGSGAPMHWVRPWRIDSTGKLIITEGELKAQVAAELLDEAFLSLPGVTSFAATIGDDLQALFRTLKRVAIAFDADFQTNPQVLSSLLRLGRTLRTSGLLVTVMKWPANVAGRQTKGIDDLLLARSL